MKQVWLLYLGKNLYWGVFDTYDQAAETGEMMGVKYQVIRAA